MSVSSFISFDISSLSSPHHFSFSLISDGVFNLLLFSKISLDFFVFSCLVLFLFFSSPLFYLTTYPKLTSSSLSLLFSFPFRACKLSCVLSISNLATLCFDAPLVYAALSPRPAPPHLFSLSSPLFPSYRSSPTTYRLSNLCISASPV